MIRYLNSPLRTKYKYYHFRLYKKGFKGIYKIKDKDVNLKIKSNISWFLTPYQIEIIRRIFYKKINTVGGNMSIISFPDLPKSKKPLGLRMGKGKGKFSSWLSPIRYCENIVRFSFDRGVIDNIDTMDRQINFINKKEKDKYKRRRKQKIKLFNSIKKRGPFYDVVKEIGVKLYHKLPFYTKLQCKQKKQQYYEKFWKYGNKKNFFLLKIKNEEEKRK